MNMFIHSIFSLLFHIIIFVTASFFVNSYGAYGTDTTCMIMKGVTIAIHNTKYKSMIRNVLFKIR